MKLMLRNLFHIPLRIVERKLTNGEKDLLDTGLRQL